MWGGWSSAFRGALLPRFGEARLPAPRNAVAASLLRRTRSEEKGLEKERAQAAEDREHESPNRSRAPERSVARARQLPSLADPDDREDERREGHDHEGVDEDRDDAKGEPRCSSRVARRHRDGDRLHESLIPVCLRSPSGTVPPTLDRRPGRVGVPTRRHSSATRRGYRGVHAVAHISPLAAMICGTTPRSPESSASGRAEV